MTSINGPSPAARSINFYSLRRNSNVARNDQRAVTAPERPERLYEQAIQTADGSTSVDSRPTKIKIRLTSGIIESFDVTEERQLDTTKSLDISSLPQSQYEDYVSYEKSRIAANRAYLELQYTTMHNSPDSEYARALDTYATVVSNGEVVAKIDNQGIVETSNHTIERSLASLLGSVNSKNGPDLAQARAEAIAKMTAGRVTRATTALDQSHFDKLSLANTPQPAIDEAAMKKDPHYAQLQSDSGRLEQWQQQRERYFSSGS